LGCHVWHILRGYRRKQVDGLLQAYSGFRWRHCPSSTQAGVRSHLTLLAVQVAPVNPPQLDIELVQGFLGAALADENLQHTVHVLQSLWTIFLHRQRRERVCRQLATAYVLAFQDYAVSDEVYGLYLVKLSQILPQGFQQQEVVLFHRWRGLMCRMEIKWRYNWDTVQKFDSLFQNLQLLQRGQGLCLLVYITIFFLL
jgi:hypothetical protein